MSILSIDTQPPSGADIRALRARVTGEIVLPGDAELGHRPAGLEPRRRPAAVRGRARRVAPRTSSRSSSSPASTGCASHRRARATAPAPLASLEDAILVKTERMRRVEIDAAARRARVEGGAVWADVVEPAAEQGFVVLHGSSPDVGVAGYSLGGGMGWLARSRGLSANSVTAVEVVTADGRLVRADRDNEPDLFWAVRGGGGNFGVVTALEIQLLRDARPLRRRDVLAGRAGGRGAARLARVGRDRARHGHVARPDPALPADPGRPRAPARQQLRRRRGRVHGTGGRGRRARRAAARARPGDGHVRGRAADGAAAPAHGSAQARAGRRRRDVPRRPPGRGRRRGRRDRRAAAAVARGAPPGWRARQALGRLTARSGRSTQATRSTRSAWR